MGRALTTALIFLNAFSIVMSIKMLKGVEKSKSVFYITIGELIIFVICNTIYAFTSGGVPDEVHQASKWMIILTMLPVNVMVMFCPVASLINKKLFDEISDDNFTKRLMTIGIVAIIVIVLEVIYIKDIQIGIANFAS